VLRAIRILESVLGSILSDDQPCSNSRNNATESGVWAAGVQRYVDGAELGQGEDDADLVDGTRKKYRNQLVFTVETLKNRRQNIPSRRRHCGLDIKRLYVYLRKVFTGKEGRTNHSMTIRMDKKETLSRHYYSHRMYVQPSDGAAG
jgi:hypothetical protein